jgi:uncharacterized repeat protein (TIGR03803 family)
MNALRFSTRILLLVSLETGLVLTDSSKTEAQTFTTLRRFEPGDGSGPNGLIRSGNTLYGTALDGGTSGFGTVFKINTDGTHFVVLHDFTQPTNGVSFFNNDGVYPFARLIISGNTLFGTAAGGGTFGCGTVFKINADGTGFMTLHSFAGFEGEGVGPSGLVASGDTLYGTTFEGGTSDRGTLFSLGTGGTGFMTLHTFAGYPIDGAFPKSALIVSSNTLYGTTAYGGASGGGTVFAVNIDGTGFTNLYSFSSAIGRPGTNSDGVDLEAGLLLSGNTLYGTASGGGSEGGGTVFSLNTDGAGFTTLHSFTTPNPSVASSLILSGNTLYGTRDDAQFSANGTVFALKTDGTGFTVLHRFLESGLGPQGHPLTLFGNTLYGSAGGDSSIIFSISFFPRLTITQEAENVVLMWPTNCSGFDYTGYTLESTANLGFLNWSTNFPASAVINGQRTVTVPVTGAQQFFWLNQ